MPGVRSPILSPLRYPGAKRRLAGYVSEALRLNDQQPELIVEPFAGSASVTLQMLDFERAERAVLGELDPWVAAFWKTALYDSEWLIGKVEGTEPTLELWNRMKRTRAASVRNQAYACLYLNRTSFSGILASHAGAIGGQKQTSDYDIGCRFPVKTLVRRLEQVAVLADRVEAVVHGTWQRTMARARRFAAASRFAYLDPPFFRKADRLYRFFFQEKEHTALRDWLSEYDSPWLLSYDSAPEILQLYEEQGWTPRTIDLLYSTKANMGMKPASEIIISNLQTLPMHGRVWKSNREWRDHRAVRSVALPAEPLAVLSVTQ